MHGKPPSNWGRINALRAQAGMAGDNVPASAFTAADYASKYRLPYRTATDQLARLVVAGRLKTGRKRTRLPSGRQGLMRFYWP